MAFSTRRYVKHIDKYGVVHRLEIQEDGFGGSASSISTTGQVFRFEHETHAGEDEEILNVYENPVQKGSIELFLRVDNSTDRTLITDIFNGDEDDFRLVWKRDGTVFWTGTILNDMLEYPESDYPYMAKLWAKDFSRLQGVDYALDDTRQTLITTFADLLDNLGYSLDIQTHTSWITEDTTDATDFLQQIYHETKALRNFARTGDESDTTITVFEALDMMCRNFGLVCRQEGGVFKLIQYSEYETPSSVNVTVYNPNGTEKTAATSTDLSLDASSNDITITDRSITRAFKAIRRARNKYDHRTSVSNLSFPESVVLDAGNTSESQTQLIISDGDQRLVLAGDIQADIPENEANGRVQWQIEIDTGTKTYYWDNDATTPQWTETTTINETDLTFVGPGAQTASSDLWIGSLSIETDDLPSDADGTLEVTLLRGLSDSSFANETRWEDVIFSIKNPVASENSDSIDYVLTQSGGYSSVFNLADTWFGDGPLGYSPGALRYGSSDSQLTSDSWQQRGTTTGYRNFHENLLKEIIDLQRGNRVKTDGSTLGADYDSEKILTYRSKSLAYTGGSFDGEGGDWHPVLFEINVATGSDTFEDLPKFTDETGSGTGSTGGGSSGGLDQSTADNRYFKQSSLLSEASDLPTLRSNIGLSIGSDVQGHSDVLDDISLLSADDGNVIIGNGTEFVVESGDTLRTSIGLGTDDDVEFNSLTVNSQLLFTLGSEQLLSTDANVQFNEVDIGGNWKLDSSPEGGVERLRIQALGADDGAELFIQSKGSADLARIALTPDSSTANYSFVTLESNGSHQIINSSSEGTASTLPLSIRVDGTEALGVDTSRNLTTHANLADDGFSTGFQGSNWQITDAGQAEFEDVFIRGGLTAYEAIINRVRYNFGNTVLSAGGGKVASVSGSAGSETVVFEDPEGNTILPVAEGDLLLLQNWDLNRTTIIKRIWRKVASISGSDVTLTKDGDMPSDTGSIVAGDELVVNGNDGTTANRDAIIFQSVTETTHPFIKIQDNINSFTDWGSDSTTQVLIGDLTDAPDLSNGTTPSGIGFFAKGSAYLEGEIVASSGDIGGWLIDDPEISGGNLNDGEIIISSDNSAGSMGLGGFDTNGAGIPSISIRKQDTGTSDRAYLMLGETFVNGTWTDRMGLSFIAFKNQSPPHFELSRDMSGGGITAKIAGINFDNSKLYTGDGTNGYVGLGATSGATDRAFWAGSPNTDGSGDTAFYIQQNGEIFHNSIGTNIFSRQSMASFGDGTTAGSLTGSEWTDTVSVTGAGNQVDRRTKIRVRFFKRFGVNDLIVKGFARRTTQSGTGSTNVSRIYASISTDEDFVTVTSSSYQEFTLILDISTLSDDSFHIVEIEVYAEADGDSSAEPPQTFTETVTYLREDVYIVTSN